MFSECQSWHKHCDSPDFNFLGSGEQLLLDDIPRDITFTEQASLDQLSLKAYRAATEREFIIARLKLFNGNISQVAQSLAIDRTNLHKKINQYAINKEQSFNWVKLLI